MKSVFTIALLTLASCGAVEAKSYKKTKFKGGNDDLFISASAGMTNHVVGDDENAEAYKESDTSFGVNFDYRFYKYLSIGLGYVDFGEAEQFTEEDGTETLTLTTAGSGLTAALTWHTDIKDGPWYFYAKIGRIAWDVDLIADLNDTDDVAASGRSILSSSGDDMFTGFGGAYHINENTRIGLNFEQYKMDYGIVDPEDETSDIYKHKFNQASISVTYSF